MAAAPAIQTVSLSKTYRGGVRALYGLDLRVEHGEVFGFLGPNGAGKSTTIRLLLDLIRPTEGRASIFGHDCQRESRAARALTGYLPGDVRVWSGLSGEQTVDLVAGVRGAEQARARGRQLADRLGLNLEH